MNEAAVSTMNESEVAKAALRASLSSKLLSDDSSVSEAEQLVEDAL
ncbi:MAG: hypothetical protein ABIP48_28570 [Planctomycetota bacterium]